MKMCVRRAPPEPLDVSPMTQRWCPRRNRDQSLAALERDVTHLPRRRVETEESALAPRIDLRGPEIVLADRLAGG